MLFQKKQESIATFQVQNVPFFKKAYFSHIVFIYLPTSNMLQIDNYNAIPDFISILEVNHASLNNDNGRP